MTVKLRIPADTFLNLHEVRIDDWFVETVSEHMWEGSRVGDTYIGKILGLKYNESKHKNRQQWK